MGPALVSSYARRYLLNRVRLALGPSGWAYWQQRDLADKSISAGGSRTTRRPRLLALADALLVQFEQCSSYFHLCWLRRFVITPSRPIRSGVSAHRPVLVLPV